MAEPEQRVGGADRGTAQGGIVYPTRRSLRESAQPGRATPVRLQDVHEFQRARTAVGHPVAASTAAARPTPSVRPQRRRSVPRRLFSSFVMLFAFGLVATIALPAYAFDPASAATLGGSAAGASGAKAKHSGTGAQSLTVDASVQVPSVKRDAGATATSAAVLKRAAIAKSFSGYSGPTAADYIKNPAYPDFSLEKVYETALQYKGVPYVFGGATPNGFDCSGFVMFVYAQFGVALQHSVHMQDAEGIHISEADAQPGDVVVFNDDSHDGFYAGNGMILHAPYPGASVREQPIWSTDVHFVRFGVK